MNVSISQYNITFNKNKVTWLATTRHNYKNKKRRDFTTVFQVWGLTLYKLKYSYHVKYINLLKTKHICVI